MSSPFEMEVAESWFADAIEERRGGVVKVTCWRCGGDVDGLKHSPGVCIRVLRAGYDSLRKRVAALESAAHE